MQSLWLGLVKYLASDMFMVVYVYIMAGKCLKVVQYMSERTVKVPLLTELRTMSKNAILTPVTRLSTWLRTLKQSYRT